MSKHASPTPTSPGTTEYDLSEGLAFFWRKLSGEDGKEISRLQQKAS